MTKIGYRYTKPRKLIFELLEHFHKPITAQEVFLFLKKKKKQIDLTSVYRTLDLMKKSAIVDEIEFGDGKKRYELAIGENHHHHLICKNCGDVENIENERRSFIK